MPKGVYLRKPMSEVQKRNIGLGNKGKPKPMRTLEHCVNLSKALTGKVCAIETRKKLSDALVGRNLTEEHKIKIGLGNKDKIRTTETIEKLVIAYLGNTHSIDTRKKMSITRKGKKHYWVTHVGGDLYTLINSTLEHTCWKREVFKRDNFTCIICGSKHLVAAHHVKQFALLYLEFLQQYSQFSPLEDIETLLRLAITYAPFWDISNGQTLCQECHRKTENYGRNITKGGKTWALLELI